MREELSQNVVNGFQAFDGQVGFLTIIKTEPVDAGNCVNDIAFDATEERFHCVL